MSSIWPEFGFRESLYASTPIPPSAEGENLLVGRERELKQLRVRLASSTLHPTIEGENGVGKTSLVSVAGYQLLKAFSNHNSAQALIPLGKAFQLGPEVTVHEFRRRVLFEVAQGLVENFELLRAGGLNVPEVTEVRKWLGKAMRKNFAGGVSIFGVGANLASNVTPNTTTGFSEAGFATLIETWLRETFPTPESGGFICVIDNLELMQTHRSARHLLESLRDEVLGLQGLRWVLCGSRGIVLTVASSTRLEGRLAEPILLGPLPHAVVPDVVGKRRDAYRIADWAVAPVGRRSFRLLYEILNNNLRNALRYSENFAVWLAENYDPPWIADVNDQLLDAWLADQADRHLAETNLGQAAWRVFDSLVALGGTCSPSDHEKFGYKTPMALRPQIKALEDVNLIDSAVDDVDKRRKTISISPRGWLVRYARAGYVV